MKFIHVLIQLETESKQTILQISWWLKLACGNRTVIGLDAFVVSPDKEYIDGTVV